MLYRLRLIQTSHNGLFWMGPYLEASIFSGVYILLPILSEKIIWTELQWKLPLKRALDC